MFFHTEKGEKETLDSLDWSKKFEVLSISRLDLSAFGLTTEQINQLTDEDMEHIAEELQNRYHLLDDFKDDVVFIARLVLAEQEETG